MRAVVGLFETPALADRAQQALRAAGFSEDQLGLVVPGASSQDITDIPTTEAEPPGVGRALGAVVGGAAGATAGIQLAVAAASVLVLPIAGPVIVTGFVAGAALGLGAGAVVGKALDNELTDGLPRDELFVYEDALRQGRAVVVVMAADESRVETAQGLLQRAGAESVDAARNRWWVGLRNSEAARHTASEPDFARDEPLYRAGFEAALARDLRGTSYDHATEVLRERYRDAYAHEAFRRGYEAGRSYHRALFARSRDPHRPEKGE
jgi:hypothetical protein